MSKKQEAEVEARLKKFWDDHKDFDSGWARYILNEVAQTLPFIFEFSAIRPGLEQLYVKSGVSVPRELLEQQVIGVWDEHSEQYVKPPELDLEKLDLEFDFFLGEPDELPTAILRPLPIFKLALAIRAYADYGLLLHEVDVFDFLERFPRHWMGQPALAEGESWAEDTTRIVAARARWKLDHERWGLDHHESVTPDELAALARVSRKSIMNLAAPGKGGVLQKGSDDQITRESAMRWLLSRPDFLPSIWQQQKKIHVSVLPKQTPSTVEPLFVPVAADGSWFSPAERRQPDGHYQVGNGDDEKQFDDYWTALDFLARAASPRWRYADTAGRWRIKTGTGWERKAREEVEKLLSRSAQMESKKINHTRKA